MSNFNEEKLPKVPQDAIDAIMTAEKIGTKLKENLDRVMRPVVADMERMNDTLSNHLRIPDISMIELAKPPHLIQEENAWQRHSENIEAQKDIIKYQDSILAVQKEMYKDQQSGKKYVIWGLVLSAVAAVTGVIALFR